MGYSGSYEDFDPYVAEEAAIEMAYDAGHKDCQHEGIECERPCSEQCDCSDCSETNWEDDCE